tara:strand:+ start:2270 stop:2578 length:309 start_codon:yes stop_codon:yes gene_type:complete
MLDMMKKLQEAQRQMKEIKGRLDTITVSGYSKNKEVVARANGNRKILGIEIAPDTNLENKVALENHVLEAVNNSLNEAEKVNESEMKSAAGSMMPAMGGLFK